MGKTEHRPAPGAAKPGQPYSPESDDSDAGATDHPRPAPAPGTPLTHDEYKRLKDEARRRSNADDVPAQEDPGQS